MAEMPLNNEIEQRFGVLPNFFRLANDTPEVTANLWGFAQFAYLDSPLPSLFKERLFVYLSRFCKVRYCIARHIGFLVGLGYPAGDRDCLPQTVEQVLPLLQRPLPRGEALELALALCAAADPNCFEFPSPDSVEESAIFACATHVFLQTPDAPRAIAALQQVLGTKLEFLNVFLAFVRMAHYWTQIHPELRFEDDINHLLATHETLANYLLNDPEVKDTALNQQVLEELASLRQLKEQHESLTRAYEVVSCENERLPIERQERQRVEANLRQSKAQLEDERKQAKATLQESESRLRLALKIGKLGSWQLDLKTKELLTSDQCKANYGFSPDANFSHQALLNRIHPDDRAWVEAAIQQAIEQHSDYDVEYRNVWDDGSIHWALVRGCTFYDSDGTPLQMHGMSLDITDRKRAEAALRESQERLQLALDASEMGTFLWHIQDDRGRLDARMLELFGLPTDSTLTPTEILVTSIHPDDRRGYAEAVHRAINPNGNGSLRQEVRVVHPDGSVRWLAISGQTFFETELRLAAWMAGIAADITENKRREANLAFLAEVSQDLVRLMHIDETMDWLGEKIGRFFGVKQCIFAEHADEFETSIVSYGWNAEDAPSLKGTYRTRDFLSNELMAALMTGEPLIVSETQSDVRVSAESYGALGIRSFIIVPLVRDRERRFQISIIDNKPREWRDDEIELMRELTTRIWTRLERARAEAALRVSEEKYRTLFESIDQGFCVIEVLFDENSKAFDYRFLEINPAFEKQTGLISAQGKRMRELAPNHEEHWFEIYGNIALTGEPNRFENCAAALHRWYDVYAFRIGYPDERKVAVVFRDISDRKTAEQEREQLLAREQAAREVAENANRIKDEFLAVLSHELRSPLNPILGWSSLLRKGRLDAGKTAYALETIERNAQLQVQLIEDLLDVSRIMRGKLTLNRDPVNLATTIRAALETVRLAAEAKSIQIQTEVDAEVGPVLGDSARLQQIIWNLLTNAVKFTPEGGQVEIGLQQIGTQAQIQVRDTGKGIDPDFLPHVFEYFQQADSTTTRKFGGLGLGLAIVHHLVELHGGTVQANSQGDGQGATFTVSLPLLRQTDRQTKDEPEDSSGLTPLSSPLAGLRVLLVDDESDTCDLIAFMLEQSGAIVTAVTSAADALQAFRRTRFDVLTSDIGMPGMDGYMLIRQIRTMPPEQGGKISAIALTAYAGELDQQQAISAGFQKHIAKPIKPEVLVQTIESLVGKRRVAN